MSKFHVIVSNSDGEIISCLNLSLVGMLNVILDGWTPIEGTDEDILFSLKEYYDALPVMCVKPDDHPCRIFISNGDTLSDYDLNRLFETKKALLKWAKTQIKRKLSEQTEE